MNPVLFFITTLTFTVCQSASIPPPSRHTIIKQAQCATCRALFSELTLEVLRHNLHIQGEEEILDSVEAACLGVVQNYTISTPLSSSPVSSWVIFSPESERMEKAENNGEKDMMTTIQNAILMKDACAYTGEHVGMEISEGVWKEVQLQLKGETNLTENAITFCNSIEDSGCKRPKKIKKNKNKNKNKNKKRTKNKTNKSPTTSTKQRKTNTPTTTPDLNDNQYDQYAEVLQKLDADGSISRMLRDEQDDPSSMMSPVDKARFYKASAALECMICKAVVATVMQTQPKYVLQSESELIPIIEKICIGPDDTSVPVLLGIAPPPLPPLWTDKYYIEERKEDNQWYLKTRYPKEKKYKKKKNGKKLKKKIGKPVVKRSKNIKKYRNSMTSEDHFEKVTMVQACKNVVKAKEDVIAQYVRVNDMNQVCSHVCNNNDN